MLPELLSDPTCISGAGEASSGRGSSLLLSDKAAGQDDNIPQQTAKAVTLTPGLTRGPALAQSWTNNSHPCILGILVLEARN